ncbi:cytochrome P450 [Actinomadura hibisca]|uniref:cytochrome P450 n=1 Tax=Actinomadura hibisca TaxID=68565 RepID=UPI0008353820|nr:cytochrome P450 [Actinomadura hibisca]
MSPLPPLPPTPPDQPLPSDGQGLVALYDPGVIAYPEQTYEHLLARYGSLAPVVIAPGVPVWLALDFQRITSICRTPHLWTRDTRAWRLWAEGRIGDQAEILAMLSWRPNLLFAEEAEHGRLRRPVTDALKGLDVKWVAARTGQVVQRLIAEFAADGHADLVGQYCRPLVRTMMGELFGLTPDSTRRLTDLVTRIWDGADAPTALGNLEHLLSGVIADRQRLLATGRRLPADFTSALVSAPGLGSVEEMIQTMVVTIGAGCEPTANLISSAVALSLTDPAVAAALADGEMQLPDLLHFTLRQQPPITHYPGLVATRDNIYPGVRAGDLVLLGLAAAGLPTPALHPMDPRGLHIGNRSGVGFGAGDHACPAQHIALLIAHIAIAELRAALPGLSSQQRPQDLRHRQSVFARALMDLPVTFTAQHAQRPAPASRTSARQHPATAASPPWQARRTTPSRPPSRLLRLPFMRRRSR